MSDEIAFKYDEKKNPGGTWIDGVPLADLTAARFKRLPKHLQAAVKAQPYYVAAEKPTTKKDKEVKADG
jgi:hypothetical protein